MPVRSRSAEITSGIAVTKFTVHKSGYMCLSGRMNRSQMTRTVTDNRRIGTTENAV